MPNFDFNDKATQGLLIGIFSAIIFFKELNFKKIQHYGRWINTNDLSTICRYVTFITFLSNLL